MTSVMTRRRWSTRHNGWRYEVRYRLGGRHTNWVSCGTFPTKAEADACVRWARMELAEGRIPDRRTVLEAHAAEMAARVTVAQAFTEFIAHRIDVSESRRASYGKAERRLGPLARVPVGDVSEQDVLAWRDRLLDGMQPRSVRQYIGVLAQVLDHAHVRPNPARADIPLPRQARRIHRPPTMSEVAALISGLPVKYRLPVRVKLDTDRYDGLTFNQVEIDGESA